MLTILVNKIDFSLDKPTKILDGSESSKSFAEELFGCTNSNQKALIDRLLNDNQEQDIFEQYADLDKDNWKFLLSDISGLISQVQSYIDDLKQLDASNPSDFIRDVESYFEKMFSKMDSVYGTNLSGAFSKHIAELVSSSDAATNIPDDELIDKSIATLKNTFDKMHKQQDYNALGTKMSVADRVQVDYFIEKLATIGDSKDGLLASSQRTLLDKIENEDNIIRYVSMKKDVTSTNVPNNSVPLGEIANGDRASNLSRATSPKSHKLNDDISSEELAVDIDAEELPRVVAKSELRVESRVKSNAPAFRVSLPEEAVIGDRASDLSRATSPKSHKLNADISSEELAVDIDAEELPRVVAKSEPHGENSAKQDFNSQKFMTNTFPMNNIFAQNQMAKSDFVQSQINEQANEKQVFSNVRLADIGNISGGFIKQLPQSGEFSARLMLEPSWLGSIVVEVKMKESVAEVSIKVASKDTMGAVENQISVLKEKLSQLGIEADKIDVSLDSSASDEFANLQSGSNNDKEKRDFINTFKNSGEKFEIKEELEENDIVRLDTGRIIEKYV